MADCIFCKRLSRLNESTDADLICSFPNSLAFLGPWQFYTGYCVLVSRTHVTELYHLDDESRRAYYDEMCDVASTIARVFNPRKMNYELLGNQVPHLHWHLFPRYSDDPDFLKPVWLAIGRADDDPLEKRRLETGRLDRADILSRLQAEFQRPRATQ